MPLRERFPIFREKAYINSCSHGALSTNVRAAYEQYLNDRDRLGADWEGWVEKLEVLRQMTAGLVDADADEIAITSSLSEGLNALVSALDFSSVRNKVVVTDFDFPTTAQIFRAQTRRGAEVVNVPAGDDGKQIPLEHFESAIDDRTLIVSIPHICYRNGSRLDLAPIIDLAHRSGALVFVDCYQSIGTTPLDVRKLDVDFLAAGMLKYLVASSGVAFLYVKQELAKNLYPATSGWFAQADVNAMDIYQHVPSPTARRFESGTPNVPNIYAAIAGLKLVNEVGIDEIEKYVRTLTSRIKQRAQEQGFRLATPESDRLHGPQIAIKTSDMYQLVELLKQDGIITSCRDDNLRISPHFYNNLEDIDRLFTSLIEHKNLLV